MKTTLEEHIIKNRSDLDTVIPDDEFIWKGISSRLETRKRAARLQWKAVAALLILLSVGSVSIYSVNRTLHQQPAWISLNDISRELGQEEKQFRQDVFRKMDEIRSLDMDPELSIELYRELHQINLQYDAYLSDLQQMGNNPKVIRGLIRCYEQKIKILEKTIREIEKNDRHENNHN